MRSILPPPHRPLQAACLISGRGSRPFPSAGAARRPLQVSKLRMERGPAGDKRMRSPCSPPRADLHSLPPEWKAALKAARSERARPTAPHTLVHAPPLRCSPSQVAATRPRGGGSGLQAAGTRLPRGGGRSGGAGRSGRSRCSRHCCFPSPRRSSSPRRSCPSPLCCCCFCCWPRARVCTRDCCRPCRW